MEQEEREWSCIAFAGNEKIAQGTLLQVASIAKKYADKHPESSILIFDDWTSAVVEIDFRGSLDDVLKRLQPEAASNIEKTGPGRPKLGVVSREIGLLPRHWEWLSLQPGGASVTLRKLVEDARKQNNKQDERRRSQNAAYKFMAAMAGNLPHFEEASRAFFAGNRALFETLTLAWPKDVRAQSLKLGASALGE